MSNRLRFFSSSVGTKILIAVTGLSLFGFLIVHLAGNLLLLVGPAAFNHYSHKLISNPLVYIAEAGLGALFVLHVFKALTNWASNRSARPVGYQLKQWAGYTSRKTVASTTMIYTGVVTFIFVLLHLKTFKFGTWYQVAEEPEVRDLYRLTLEVFTNPLYVGFYVLCMVLIFLHLRHGLSSAMQSLGLNHPRYNPIVLTIGTILAVLIGGGFAFIPIWAYSRGGQVMTLDARIPGGPIEGKWDRHKFESKLVSPANRRKFSVIVVGTGLAGGVGRRLAGRAGLQRAELLHPRQPASRAQHRCPGRHQRGEELPQRWRQRLSAVLRHGQGRRLPRARGQRLPARAAVGEHHRPVRRPGRAVRARVRRPARQPVVRRRAGVAHVLRPRADRPAAAARRLPGADAPGGRRHRHAAPAARDAGPGGHRRQGARDHHAQPDHRRARALRGRRGVPGHRRLRHRVLPLDQRGELQRHRRVAGAQAGRATSPTPASRRFTRPAFPVSGDHQSQAHADEREPAQRRPRVGARSGTANATAGADSRGGADYYLERRYPSFGNLVPRDVASRAAKAVCDEGRGVGETEPGRVPRFHAMRSNGSASTRSARATATCSRCTRRSRTRIRTRRRCASTPPCTTRWAGCGWTTT